MDTNMTIRCDTQLREAFHAAAENVDRPAAQIIREFMRDFAQKNAHEISPEEKARRTEIVAFAKANLELEGETISPELLDAAMMYANGQISLEAFMDVSANG
jgi:predicted transcriptional regulator